MTDKELFERFWELAKPFIVHPTGSRFGIEAAFAAALREREQELLPRCKRLSAFLKTNFNADIHPSKLEMFMDGTYDAPKPSTSFLPSPKSLMGRNHKPWCLVGTPLQRGVCPNTDDGRCPVCGVSQPESGQ